MAEHQAGGGGSKISQVQGAGTQLDVGLGGASGVQSPQLSSPLGGWRRRSDGEGPSPEMGLPLCTVLVFLPHLRDFVSSLRQPRIPSQPPLGKVRSGRLGNISGCGVPPVHLTWLGSVTAQLPMNPRNFALSSKDMCGGGWKRA